jgi:hypothetical protein
LYVTQTMDRLVENAERLLDQSFSMGPESDVTVLELATGGYYLIPGQGHDPEAVQIAHGARAVWQVRNSSNGVIVDGRSGKDSCLLQRARPSRRLVGALRDAPAYVLI